MTMELEELDARLRKITPSERSYREGSTLDWDQYEKTELIGGRKVYRLSAEHFMQDGRKNVGATPAEGAPGIPTETRPFIIRKNSRFSEVPEHVHTVVEMSYVYAGSCPQTVDDRELLLKEGQVLLLDTDCPHSVAALGEPDIMLSLMFSRDFLAQSLMDAGAPESEISRFLISSLAKQTDHQHYIHFHSQRSRRVRRFFEELLCEYLDPSPAAESIELHLFQLLMMELVSIYEADYTRRATANSRVSVAPIIRYIEEHYRDCTQEEVAREFFISPNYVSTLLKRHTGMTYMQMVQSLRLTRAAALLRSTDDSVEAIAKSVGYENMSFFYKKFHARFGCAPAELREHRTS